VVVSQADVIVYDDDAERLSSSETKCCGTTRPLVGRAASGVHSPRSFPSGRNNIEDDWKRGSYSSVPINGNPSDSLANVPVAKFIGVRSKVPESHQFQFCVLCCF
jgi:hypothetical protein